MNRPFTTLAPMVKPVNHIDALKSLMDKRAFDNLTEDQKSNLDSVIATYTRLYVGPA